MCFLLSCILLLTFLNHPTEELQWFRMIPTKLCSQIKLRSLLLVRLKFDVCFARNEQAKHTSRLDYNLNFEQMTQRFGLKNQNLMVKSKKYENNLNTSREISDAIISRGSERTSPSVNTFYRSLENFEHRLYWTTFSKLAAIGRKERRENGITFVQSGVFLFMALLAISMEMDEVTKDHIQKSMEYHFEDTELSTVLRDVTSQLPTSSASFKFCSVMRVVLKDGLRVHNIKAPAEAIKLNIKVVANTDASQLTSLLNDMVSNDSGGAMKNTFEEDELVNGICAVLVTTLYVRPRWRTSPVVLNGTSEFHDADNPKKWTRMIRINDIMLYGNLDDLDAEAVQIQYATPDLALLVLVPHGNSLRRLASRVSSDNLAEIYRRMKKMRVAVTLPLYTLRMTLLLQNKLEEMGITKLFIPKTSNASECEHFLLSHAVQRIMFWSEAGRHAFKDDGIQWDKEPEEEVVVNRPYLFYVRWKNITLVNGNFVL